MTLIWEFYVDGGCRGNGHNWAIGAAAACFWHRRRRLRTRTRHLDTWRYRATSQRAEILAVIIALEWALDKLDNTYSNADVEITIYSDSTFVVDCMESWIHGWVENGWRNSRGRRVANQDLLEVAFELNEEVQESAFLNYVWIPRDENQAADDACNEALDEQEYD
ncbi:ribonuclease H-like domain-containing protein [Hypoxylon sp. FL0890]|nr:ribonuclease H-like domain-containing protein [Hypoxylon sp. FL0890]